MRTEQVVALVATFSLASAAALAASPKSRHAESPPEAGAGPASVFTPRSAKSTGTVVVEGHKMTTNVMPDPAAAMKYDPQLEICLNGGYFDLATPFYEGIYEMHHLQIPQNLQANIGYHYYQSGHMVYANEAPLKQLHDNVAAFIRKTDNQAGV